MWVENADMRIQGEGNPSRDPRPALPSPRGPLSEMLVEILREVPPSESDSRLLPTLPTSNGALGEDFQLSLYLLYEIHYRGFRGVDERWEWEPLLLEFRASLESDFKATLRGIVPAYDWPIEPARVGAAIMRLVEEDDGPQLSTYMERSA